MASFLEGVTALHCSTSAGKGCREYLDFLRIFKSQGVFSIFRPEVNGVADELGVLLY